MSRSLARSLALPALVLGVLACSGVVPAPTPEPAEPAPEPTPAPDPEPAPADRDDCLVGMVGVLALAPGFPAEGKKAHRGPVEARGRANDAAKVIAKIEDGGYTREGTVMCKAYEARGCATLPWAYDALAIPVYTLREGWAEIGLGRGGSALSGEARCRTRGWVELEPPMEVFSVEDLLRDNGLTHTLEGWDGVLHDDPGGAPRPSGHRGQVDFRLRSSRTVDGRLWLEVELIEGHCEGNPASRGTGWIPASDDQGRLQAWYYSDC